MISELFLIVTLCAGTTQFYVSKSTDIVNSKMYAISWDENMNPYTPICEKVEDTIMNAYKLSAIETWFCKYFGHREWVDVPPDRYRVIAVPAIWPPPDPPPVDPKQRCSLCKELRKGSWKPVQKTEMEWVWE